MIKIFCLLICVCCLTGCYSEYAYFDDNYSTYTKGSCTYTYMPYIKDYIDNRDKYIDYNHYMQVNYFSQDAIKNAANARRAYKNFIDMNDANRAFYRVKID